jgi:hypothetical protein
VIGELLTAEGPREQGSHLDYANVTQGSWHTQH